MPNLEYLTAVIEEEDYLFLQDKAPAYAVAVEQEVNQGSTPAQIYRHIQSMTHEGREGLAIRCRNAAQYLTRHAGQK